MQKFSALDLDELINDCTGESSNTEDISNITDEELDKELQTYHSNDIVPAITDPNITGLIEQNNGASVDFNRVYKQIEKLIENGNNALATLAAIDPSEVDAETIRASSSLMLTIKNCISEFTKIHAIHLKHALSLEAEEIKQKHRLEFLQAKNNIKNKSTESEIQNATVLTEFSDDTTKNIFEFLQKEKQKRDKEKLNNI